MWLYAVSQGKMGLDAAWYRTCVPVCLRGLVVRDGPARHQLLLPSLPDSLKGEFPPPSSQR